MQNQKASKFEPMIPEALVLMLLSWAASPKSAKHMQMTSMGDGGWLLSQPDKTDQSPGQHAARKLLQQWLFAKVGFGLNCTMARRCQRLWRKPCQIWNAEKKRLGDSSGLRVLKHTFIVIAFSAHVIVCYISAQTCVDVSNTFNPKISSKVTQREFFYFVKEPAWLFKSWNSTWKWAKHARPWLSNELQRLFWILYIETPSSGHVFSPTGTTWRHWTQATGAAFSIIRIRSSVKKLWDRRGGRTWPALHVTTNKNTGACCDFPIFSASQYFPGVMSTRNPASPSTR